MKPLRYAAIGVAGIAGAHFSDIAKRPNVEVVGLVDVNPESLAAAQARFPDAVAGADAETVLAATKPDLVSVCTPNRWHAPMTKLAMAHGANVACEKPMAMTLAEAREMEAVRAAADLVGYINFSYRNVAAFRFMRELIRQGELGTIHRVNAVYLQGWIGAGSVTAGWRNDKNLAGFGSLGDLGIHMIDAVRFITGAEVVSVVGQAVTRAPNMVDAAGKPVTATTDDNAAFLATLSDGATAVFETSQTAPGYTNHHRIEVSGERGTIIGISERPNEMAYYVGPTLTRYATWQGEIPWIRVPTGFMGTQKADGVALAVDAVRGLVTDYPKFADGVAAQVVVEAIDQAQRERRWVDIAGL